MKKDIDENSVMLGKIHDSLYDSLKSIGSTDTILVGATYGFNILMLVLITLSISSTAIFITYIVTLLAVNVLILLTFKNSRDLRQKLYDRQLELYSDLSLEKYFDESSIENYKKRYSFWFALDIVLGSMVLIVALVLKFG